MQFPKLKKIYVRGVGLIEVRPYLTTSDIDSIINTIQSQTTDYAMRIMMMYSMIMSLCTNLKDFEEEEVNIEVVEGYYLNGVFDHICRHIKGFDILFNGVKNLAISDIYARFEGVITEFTEQFKDINLDESMKQFETELSKLKDVKEEQSLLLTK